MRNVPVAAFDPNAGDWVDVHACGAVEREELTLTTYNIWFNASYAQERYAAIADLLSRDLPDVMVFQEVTPAALTVFLAQPWVREHYLCAAVLGGRAGNYGMLMLSRVPVTRVTYRRVPILLSRGVLRAEFTLNNQALVVCCVHLDSGKSAARRRGWQLSAIFRSLRSSENAVILGDFNMRDHENGHIPPSYRDVWPALRPGEDGFTEDTSINHMRFDMKNKHRHVRFDRFLVKGPAWSPASVDLLGTEPVSSALPRVFPSDHFGVRCRLVRDSS